MGKQEKFGNRDVQQIEDLLSQRQQIYSGRIDIFTNLGQHDDALGTDACIIDTERKVPPRDQIRLLVEDRLDVLRIHIFPTNDDEILLAARDIQFTGMEEPQVPGFEIFAEKCAGSGFWVVEIPFEHAVAVDRHFANPVFREDIPGIIDDSDVDVGQRCPGRSDLSPLGGWNDPVFLRECLDINAEKSGRPLSGRAHGEGILCHGVTVPDDFFFQACAGEFSKKWLEGVREQRLGTTHDLLDGRQVQTAEVSVRNAFGKMSQGKIRKPQMGSAMPDNGIQKQTGIFHPFERGHHDDGHLHQEGNEHAGDEAHVVIVGQPGNDL
ncbi:MAG TPA: hypothetical protein PLP29_05680 [Candidatus Ozemobacteraceae bacterium]|nr:hypothetical protein [Candidatus Ozemobacteraceae bacterium]